MDLNFVQDSLKNLTDVQLQMEVEQPSGQVPPFMSLAEMERRRAMRDAYEGERARASESRTTVAEDMAGMGGLPGNPNISMPGGDQGLPMPQPAQNSMMPGGGLPAGFATGGMVPKGIEIPPGVSEAGFGPYENIMSGLGALAAQQASDRKQLQKLALLDAGLRIMGGNSPYFGVNLGQAAGAVQQYGTNLGNLGGQQADVLSSAASYDINQRARTLAEMQLEFDRERSRIEDKQKAKDYALDLAKYLNPENVRERKALIDAMGQQYPDLSERERAIIVDGLITTRASGERPSRTISEKQADYESDLSGTEASLVDQFHAQNPELPRDTVAQVVGSTKGDTARLNQVFRTYRLERAANPEASPVTSMDRAIGLSYGYERTEVTDSGSVQRLNEVLGTKQTLHDAPRVQYPSEVNRFVPPSAARIVKNPDLVGSESDRIAREMFENLDDEDKRRDLAANFGVEGYAKNIFYTVEGTLDPQSQDAEAFARGFQAVEGSAKYILGNVARQIQEGGRVSVWLLQLVQRQIPEAGSIFETAPQAKAKLDTLISNIGDGMKAAGHRLNDPGLDSETRANLKNEQQLAFRLMVDLKALRSRFKDGPSGGDVGAIPESFRILSKERGVDPSSVWGRMTPEQRKGFE